MDKDLSSTAVETLKNMIRELPRWRLNVVGGFLELFYRFQLLFSVDFFFLHFLHLFFNLVLSLFSYE